MEPSPTPTIEPLRPVERAHSVPVEDARFAVVGGDRFVGFHLDGNTEPFTVSNGFCPISACLHRSPSFTSNSASSTGPTPSASHSRNVPL